MSQYNPYAPPQPVAPPYYAPEDASESAAVPDPIVEQLRGTRPWVMFLSILGFIGSGLMGIAGLFMLAAGKIGNLPAGLGAIYIVLGAIYLFPALYLLRFGSSIALLVRDPRMERLRVALGHQRSFWKLVGIMTAIIVALYPIAIVIGVVAVIFNKR